MKTCKYKMGFTLVEMLIVVAIIVMLAAMINSIASRLDNQAKEKGMKNIFTILEEALIEYCDYSDTFPVQPEEDFTQAAAHSQFLYVELDSVPASQNIMKKISDKLIQDKYEPGAYDPPRYEIYDLWGTVLDYRYIAGENFPELISAGRDRTFGTADDISDR
jgi:prepilin-type N-terminal cleavage/methylation domain-containing protein